ncbi:MAG: 50S ribosome-binding GTPase [Campylobacterales bacterium]|nr:50S ribosome-binding GTPase [Campylobacterales bacterium]
MSQLIPKYLPEEDMKTLYSLQSAVEKNTTTVTCMGLYNHGKSTLLNTLIKDFEHTTFKTADVRETSNNKAVEHGNVIFVDTPGLNSREHDDKRVMDAVKESDINLFVHTITTGEFDKNEIEFLHSVKNHWGNPQEFIERTIFVLSRIDKADGESDIANTKERMLSQIDDIFKCKARIIPVSAQRYTKGRLEEKKSLVEKSNIEVLEAMIDEISENVKESIMQTKKNRLEKGYNDLVKKLYSKVQENKLEVSKLKNERKKFQDSLNQDIQKVETTLKNMHAKLGGV